MEKFYNVKSATKVLFGNLELLPNVNELFEFELAYLEFSVLEKSVEASKRSENIVFCIG